MEMELKRLEVEFSENKGPVHFVNVFGVTEGNGDYFIKLGSIMPYLSSEAEESGKIEVQPLFVCAVTKSSMKAFIELLQSEYREDE